MNYTETPTCEEPMREVPIREALCGIEKKLTETSICLMAIIEDMIGAPAPEEKAGAREARCMQDQIFMIDALSGNVMGMANRIKELLF